VRRATLDHRSKLIVLRGWASLVAETRSVCSEGAGAFLSQLSAWLSTEFVYTSTRPLQAVEYAGKRTKAEREGDTSNPGIDPATRRELEDRIGELSKENAVLEKVVFDPTGMEPECDDRPFDYSVSARHFSTTNSPKRRTRLFPPICTTCASRSIDCRRNTLAPLVGRPAFATLYKRGTTFTRRGTTRRQNSEPRKLGWLLLAINVVSNPPFPPSSFFFSFIRSYHKAKLDLEVLDLGHELEEERAKHSHASEEIMHEAKRWLAGLQHSVGIYVAVWNGGRN
jgi:hypothetical protein